MKRIMLLASLILLALTGCQAKVEEQGGQFATITATHTQSLSSKNEKPCLTNFTGGGLAECVAGTVKQKRFVLVRSVAIPEN